MSDSSVTAFWWTGRSNFGDLLTKLLLKRFSGLVVEWAPFDKAQLIGVGSVLDVIPAQWSGIIAGAGRLFEDSHPDLSCAEIFGLRGPLSARGVPGDYVLGDPGLLADELVDLPIRDVDLGLVPHWSDTELEHRPEFLKYNPLIIRVSDSPLEVIRSIGRCKKIVSSSLHGVVVADAFGIPRRIEMTDRFTYEGNDFKFRDYAASVGMKLEIGLTQLAPRYKVQDLQHELYDMLDAVGDRVRKRGLL